MSATLANPTLWDVDHTAETLGISRRSLFTFSAPRGDLPCVRLGSRVMYRPDDVAEWINRHRVVSGSAS